MNAPTQLKNEHDRDNSTTSFRVPTREQGPTREQARQLIRTTCLQKTVKEWILQDSCPILKQLSIHYYQRQWGTDK